MKKIKIIFFGIFYTIIFISNILAIENRILFKVNNKIITSIDILTEIKYLEIINKDFEKMQTNQRFEIAKKSLIREKIKEIELIRILKIIKVEDKFFEKLLIDYFKTYNIKTISDFDDFFLSYDINPNLIKKKISIEILWNQLIYTKFKENIKIDKETIKNEIRKNTKKKEFLLSEILFNIDQDEKLDSKFSLLEKKINDKGF